MDGDERMRRKAEKRHETLSERLEAGPKCPNFMFVKIFFYLMKEMHINVWVYDPVDLYWRIIRIWESNKSYLDCNTSLKKPNPFM